MGASTSGPLGEHADVATADGFARFYRRHVGEVYSHLLRLCAGDRTLAEDLTQDTWLELVRALRAGRTECADIRWLITVARSRFLDRARRERRGRDKLALLRPTADVAGTDAEPSPADVLAVLAAITPLHRAVLVLRYVDGLAVPEIAELIGRDVTATHSLLARARTQVRRHAPHRPEGALS